MDRAPFEPGDPFDVLAEEYRQRVVALVLELDARRDAQDVTPVERVMAMICGVMTGLVGSVLCATEPAGHDTMMEAIEGYLPHARNQAQAIISREQVLQ